MNFSDYLIITTVVLALLMVGFYFYSRKNMKRVIQAQDFIEQNKTTIQIFVIDKKMEKPSPSNLTKGVFEQLPKTSRMRKMPLVKAKVGPQIVTLMCDKSVFAILPTKKNVKVELAGIYIVKIHGMNLADKKKKSWSEKMTLQMDRSVSKQK